MDKHQIMKRLDQMDLDKKEYWLIAGAAMVHYGIKPETGDIDLGCTRQLADALQEKGYPVTVLPDRTRRIAYGQDVEIFEDWLEDKVIIHEGFPVVSIDGLITMKRKLGREKDWMDLKLIQKHLG